MTPADVYCLVAERALAGGRPLDASLDDAMGRVAPVPPEVHDAVGAARAGDLRAALWSLTPLGLDPLAALAGAAAPEALAEIASRLRRLPSLEDAATHLGLVLAYAVLLLLVQAGIADLYRSKVIPALGGTQPSWLALLPIALVVPAALLLMAVASRRLRHRLVHRLAPGHQAARGLLTLSTLTRHGVPLAAGLAALDPTARAATEAALGPDGSLHHEAMGRRGEQLALEAQTVLARRVALVRAGILVTVLVLGLATLAGPYLLIVGQGVLP